MFKPIMHIPNSKRSAGITLGSRDLPGSIGGSILNSPAFSLPQLTSIIPTRGTGSTTFVRATTATTEDWEGRIRNVLSGEVCFKGSRRVRNIITGSSEDLTTGTLPTNLNVTVAATTFSFTAANNSRYNKQAAQVNANEPTVWRMEISCTVPRNVAVRCVNSGGGAGSIQFDFAVTTTPKILTFTTSFTATGGHQVHFSNIAGEGASDTTTNGVFTVRFMQCEATVNQSNQNAAEYVPVGVLSSPWSGSNVDGVKNFETQNGNTTAANVLTEANGAALATTILLGRINRPIQTNICLQSSSFATVGTWPIVITPTLVTANTRCGDITLDLIGDDDAGNLEGYTQTITFTGNAVKSISFLVAQGTSTSTAVRVRDTTATADRLLVVITWSGGIPIDTYTTGSQERAPQSLGNNVWRIFCTTTSVTAANTNSIQFFPATDAGLTVGGTGNINVGGVMAQDALVASVTIIPTTVAAVTVNEDVLTGPTSGNISDTEGTAYCEFLIPAAVGICRFIIGTTGIPIETTVGTDVLVYDGTATRTTAASGSRTTVNKAAGRWSLALGLEAAFINGGGKVEGAFDGSMNLGATVQYGGGTGAPMHGYQRNVKTWLLALADAQIAAL